MISEKRKELLKRNVLAGLALAKKEQEFEPIKDKIDGKKDKDFAKKITPSAKYYKRASISLLKSQKRQERKGYKRIIVIILVIMLVVSFNIFGIYKFGFSGFFSNMIAKVFQLPAGKVNNEKISLAEYLSDYKTLKSALESGREGVDGSSPLNKSLRDRIFMRLVVESLIKEQLRSYNKSVSNDELDSQWQIIVNQAGGKEIAEKTVSELYQLNSKSFKQRVLRPLLEKDLLQKIIIEDKNIGINIEARKKAEEALKLALQPKVDFKILASQYTEDEAGINTGGDLGWILRGELNDDEFENIIFTWPVGVVYPQIIENNSGYHIIKIEGRLTDENEERESVRVRHIMVKVNVDKYIKSLLDAAMVKKFVK